MENKGACILTVCQSHRHKSWSKQVYISSGSCHLICVSIWFWYTPRLLTHILWVSLYEPLNKVASYSVPLSDLCRDIILNVDYISVKVDRALSIENYYIQSKTDCTGWKSRKNQVDKKKVSSSILTPSNWQIKFTNDKGPPNFFPEPQSPPGPLTSPRLPTPSKTPWSL